MATTYKILGQLNPTSGTEASLYTVGGSSAVVSSLVICNQGASPATFSIATVKSGGSVNPAGAATWIFYNTTIAANDTVSLTAGITLAAGDKIQVKPSTGSISFTAYGSELS